MHTGFLFKYPKLSRDKSPISYLFTKDKKESKSSAPYSMKASANHPIEDEGKQDTEYSFTFSISAEEEKEPVSFYIFHFGCM